MSYMSAEERDKILQASPEHPRDLDDELRRRHAEVKDEFTKEQSKMQEDFKNEKTHVKELLYEQFNQAVNRLKGCIEKGDYDGEVAHRMTADWLNSELKKRGYNKLTKSMGTHCYFSFLCWIFAFFELFYLYNSCQM
jgi:hypothetical protein